MISIFVPSTGESSSVGRASAFQAECRQFEPGLSLKKVLWINKTFFIHQVFFQQSIKI